MLASFLFCFDYTKSLEPPFCREKEHAVAWSGIWEQHLSPDPASSMAALVGAESLTTVCVTQNAAVPSFEQHTASPASRQRQPDMPLSCPGPLVVCAP